MAMWRLAAGVVVGLCPTRCPVFPERCSRWYQDDFKPLQMASRLYEQNQLDAVLEMRDAENIGIGENLRMNLLPMFMFAAKVYSRLLDIAIAYICFCLRLAATETSAAAAATNLRIVIEGQPASTHASR